MDKPDTRTRLLSDARVSDEELDLAGKLYDLEMDKEHIGSVVIWIKPDWHEEGLAGDVHLKKRFKSLQDFQQYASDHRLPGQIFDNTRSGYSGSVGTFDIDFTNPKKI